MTVLKSRILNNVTDSNEIMIIQKCILYCLITIVQKRLGKDRLGPPPNHPMLRQTIKIEQSATNQSMNIF